MARGFDREDAENEQRRLRRMCEANPCIEPATRRVGDRWYCDDHARALTIGSGQRVR